MTYVVESGDTVETIARKHNISPSALMQMNNLSNASQLKVGMIITVSPSGNMTCCNAPLGAEWCPRLSLGSKGSAIEELQRRLRSYGYYNGRISGVFDRETEVALRNFQRYSNLWVSGITDRETWLALGVICRQGQSTGSCPILRLGSRGSAVSFLQSLLQRRGYFVTVDGSFGRGTENAVMALQRDNGFFANGEVDQRIWDLLGVSCVPLDSSGSHNHWNSGWNTAPNVPAAPGGYQPPMQVTPENTEPNLDGLNYNWQEIGDFRYVLTTNRYRYREGDPVQITFRKRNLTNEPIALRYPSNQLFDFYISDAQGIELWRWSKSQNFANVAREIVLAPDAAETIDIVWDQKTNNGYWVPAQTLTLWGTNTATNVSLPLSFEIY